LSEQYFASARARAEILREQCRQWFALGGEFRNGLEQRMVSNYKRISSGGGGVIHRAEAKLSTENRKGLRRILPAMATTYENQVTVTYLA
jgi:hypothetical protein